MRLLKRSWTVASTSVLLHSCFMEVTLKGILVCEKVVILRNIDSDDNDDYVFVRQEEIKTDRHTDNC